MRFLRPSVADDRIRVSWPERRAIAKATIQHSAAAGLSFATLAIARAHSQEDGSRFHMLKLWT
jgi:hypothetical protein